jgi:hypothetical protein
LLCWAGVLVAWGVDLPDIPSKYMPHVLTDAPGAMWMTRVPFVCVVDDGRTSSMPMFRRLLSGDAGLLSVV